MSTFKHSLCVVIPMFNEEKNVARCVEAVVSVLRKQKMRTVLLVVDDGSVDETISILRQLTRKYGKLLHIVAHKQNKGYGAALQTGIKIADTLGFEYILFMDSDLTNDPRDIPKFIAQISTSTDCVKASRYSGGGKMMGIPLYRQLISRIGNVFTSQCFRVGLSDCTNGFRMVRTSMLKNTAFRENKFAIILEELYVLKKRGATFSSVPVTLSSRKTTRSHFSYSLRTFFDYGKYAIKATLL